MRGHASHSVRAGRLSPRRVRKCATQHGARFFRSACAIRPSRSQPTRQRHLLPPYACPIVSKLFLPEAAVSNSDNLPSLCRLDYVATICPYVAWRVLVPRLEWAVRLPPSRYLSHWEQTRPQGRPLTKVLPMDSVERLAEQ